MWTRLREGPLSAKNVKFGSADKQKDKGNEPRERGTRSRFRQSESCGRQALEIVTQSIASFDYSRRSEGYRVPGEVSSGLSMPREAEIPQTLTRY